MSRMKLRFAVTLLLVAWHAPAPGQETTRPRETFGVTSTLVRVDAVVTDKDGKAVPDLKVEDFEILENDRPQRISQFTYVVVAPPAATAPRPQSDAPGPAVPLRRDQVRRTIALVIDDLNLSFEGTAHVRDALKKFVDEQMQPGDLAAIVRASAGMGALQQFTSDKRLLAAAVDRVRYSMLSRNGIGTFAPTADAAGGAADGSDNVGATIDRMDRLQQDVYAVGTIGALRFVVRALDELPGRKSVVMFSEGFQLLSVDTENDRANEQIRLLIEDANRASIAFYTVDAAGLPTTSFMAADNTAPEGVSDARTTRNIYRKEGLNVMADETGGLSFEDANDLAQGVARALADQSGYYLLGYAPSDEVVAAQRTLRRQPKVRMTRPGLHVRTRSSFYEVNPDAPARTASASNPLVRALTSPFGAGEIGVRLTSLFDHSKKQGSIMRTLLHIEGKDIEYQKQPDGSSKAELEIMAVTFGHTGEGIDQIARGSAIQVKPGGEDEIRRSGLVYTVSVPAQKAGVYQLRTAVRDRFSGRVGAANQLIEVPDVKKGRLALSGLLLTGVTSATPSSAGGEIEEGAKVQTDADANEAVRRFRRGSAASYGFVIYNARVDGKGGPRLESQIRVFRDGQLTITGKPKPVDPGPQTDWKRLIAGGALRFGPEMAPGDYVLQVVVTDALAKPKERVATQWIDFQLLP
jgi:VWFA-related protein